MDEMLGRLAHAYGATHPGSRICLFLPGTRAAPLALANRSSDLAPMGAEMTEDDLERFRQLGDPPPLEVRVAHDSLKRGAISSPTGVFVQRHNPLRQISMGRLRDIFVASREPVSPTWGEVGLGGNWRERPLHPISLASTTAIGQHLLHAVLRADAFRTQVSGRHESRDVMTAVADDPYVLGLFNLSHRNREVRALHIVDDEGRTFLPTRAAIMSGRYPLDRFLLVYARRDSHGGLEPAAHDFLDFMLSERGQTIIKLGTRRYMPLNKQEREDERAKLRQ